MLHICGNGPRDSPELPAIKDAFGLSRGSEEWWGTGRCMGQRHSASPRPRERGCSRLTKHPCGSSTVCLHLPLRWLLTPRPSNPALTMRLPAVIQSAPTAADYITLEEFQSKTPESFFDETRVLHYHGKDAFASVHESQKETIPIFHISADQDIPAEIRSLVEGFVLQRVELFVVSE